MGKIHGDRPDGVEVDNASKRESPTHGRRGSHEGQDQLLWQRNLTNSSEEHALHNNYRIWGAPPRSHNIGPSREFILVSEVSTRVTVAQHATELALAVTTLPLFSGANRRQTFSQQPLTNRGCRSQCCALCCRMAPSHRGRPRGWGWPIIAQGDKPK